MSVMSCFNQVSCYCMPVPCVFLSHAVTLLHPEVLCFLLFPSLSLSHTHTHTHCSLFSLNQHNALFFFFFLIFISITALYIVSNNSKFLCIIGEVLHIPKGASPKRTGRGKIHTTVHSLYRPTYTQHRSRQQGKMQR